MKPVTKIERRVIQRIALNGAPLDWAELDGVESKCVHVLFQKKGMVQINMTLPWSVELTERGNEWWAQHCDD